MNRPTTVRLIVTAGAALALVMALTPSSSAAPERKRFHETLAVSTAAGASVSAGALAGDTTYTFAFTLTNDDRSRQTFGSAQIVVPTGYDVTGETSPPAGYPNFTVRDLGDVVELTSTGPSGSGVAPGDSLLVSVQVRTPATSGCGAAVWTTAVKQSNDFSGSGNDFQPDDPAPTTTVAGGSQLTFTTQPGATQYDRAMTPAPVVTAKDACGATATGFTGTVTLTDAEGALATGATVSAVAGVATFSGLTFDDWGFDDTLTASATGFTAVTSNSFPVHQAMVDCMANRTCTTGTLTDGGDSTRVAIDADRGPADTLTASVKGVPGSEGFEFDGCEIGGETPHGTVVTFDVASRGKTVTMTLPKEVVVDRPTPNGTPFFDVCLSIPADERSEDNTFTDRYGTVGVHEGLLPDCGNGITTSCVQSRGKRAGDEILTFVLPPGDPRACWY